MATSPLSSVLSPAQIAIVQQARQLVARPQARPAAPLQPNDASAAQPQKSAQPVRGRGAIINITV